jgi:16S rRNA (cytosine967-C5)-methyltransferase
VIRRHPDIRLLRQSSDIAQTIELQKQILQNLWQQLKVGGTLLYITCSI